MTNCANCGADVAQDFCGNCGQKLKEANDRSLKSLLSDLVAHIFYFDGRFWKSYKYLLLKPGEMSREYLEGKRRKFLPPISLFLLVNLIYFIVNPISDFSLSFSDQVHSQWYSELSKDLVAQKMKTQNLEYRALEVIYNNKKSDLAKLFMILNIPIIALVLYLFTFRLRRYFYDSLIYATHFFTLVLLIILMEHYLLHPLFLEVSEKIGLISFLIIIMFFAIKGAYTFYNRHGVIAVGLGLVSILGVIVANAFYRLINFLMTMAVI